MKSIITYWAYSTFPWAQHPCSWTSPFAGTDFCHCHVSPSLFFSIFSLSHTLLCLFKVLISPCPGTGGNKWCEVKGNTIVSVHRCTVIFVVRGEGLTHRGWICNTLTYWNYFTISLNPPTTPHPSSIHSVLWSRLFSGKSHSEFCLITSLLLLL